MDFGSLDYQSAAGSVVTAASQGLLASPIKSYNTFMNRIGDALSPTRRALGNPFAKQHSLKKLSQRPDPVFAFDWLGVILDNGLSTSAQVPWEYIDAITIPEVSVETKEQFFNGTTRMTAGQFRTGSASIDIYTDRTGLAFNYADYWVRSTFRQDGFYNLPAHYKKDIVVFVLDAKRKIVVDFRLVGCIPTSRESYALGGTDMLKTSLQLSVDEVFINYDSDLTAAKASIENMFTSAIGPLGTASGLADAGSKAFGKFFGQ